MNVVGIIAEFNPFHSGHAHLIHQAKEITGSEYAVVVMNGSFVQRGEPAVFSKYHRTRAALEGGADLVLELPVRFGISSAGDFALGGVMALSSLGFVTHLAFGSEEGEIGPFQEAASALSQESEEFRRILSCALREGLPYPAARAQALAETSSIPLSLQEQPNNILGVEYCLALKKLRSPLIPVTIPRTGMGYHDRAGTGGAAQPEHPSATALRERIRQDGTPHLTLEDLGSALDYALLKSTDLTRYKDISPELARRIRRCLWDHRTIQELIQRCRTRAFTDGRIRRGLMQCLLGITAAAPSMPYLRLLGLRKEPAEKGVSSLLSQTTDSCQILSRLAADVKKLTPGALSLFQQDLFASELYRQTWCRKYGVHLPNEYQHSPVIIAQWRH